MSNKELARAFRLASQLMELHDENPFKVRSMQNAAFKIEKLPSSLKELTREEITAIEGIGKGLEAKISELLDRGSFTELDQLFEKTPAGVVQLLSIKGIGPKKVRTLWQELGVESPGELLYACNENRLVELKGFGAKTQESIRHAIEYADSNKGKFHYAVVETVAMQLLHDLENSGLARKISFTGALRRCCEVLTGFELVLTCDNTGQVAGFLESHPLVQPGSLESEKQLFRFVSVSGIPATIHLADASGYGSVLFLTTASEGHLRLLKEMKSWKEPAKGSEEEIYTSLGLPYLEPEWREGMFEFGWVKNGLPKELITYQSLRGILHNHTTYSDGIHSLEEMADYCKAMGYDYLGICDHSKSAFYANGLPPERVLQQQEDIDRLNSKMKPFRIFKGIESDILTDGSLDYDEDILKTFDFVVASVHSVLRMDETKATARLIKAIENPYTTMLGHPSGRLLLAREGYPLDYPKIIDACAANQVIIELNANPYRLDLDWRWIPYALEKGVMISINPDAHRKEGYHDMHYGVCVARKGGLTKEATFNALSIGDIERKILE